MEALGGPGTNPYEPLEVVEAMDDPLSRRVQEPDTYHAIARQHICLWYV